MAPDYPQNHNKPKGWQQFNWSLWLCWGVESEILNKISGNVLDIADYLDMMLKSGT